MNITIEQMYQHLCEEARWISLLESIASVLWWDERTMLPPAGAAYRAEQLRLLAGMIHERWTNPQLVANLESMSASALASDPHSDTGANIRHLNRQCQRKAKLPRRLVEELATASVLGQQAWQEARRNDDFAHFAPHLERIVALKREQAAIWANGKPVYDALLDTYEPGETAASLAPLFDQLSQGLHRLLNDRNSRTSGHAAVRIRGSFPPAAQEALLREILAQVGFDFHRGRLDQSAHPFCSRLGPEDCRITTRYDTQDFTKALFGGLHEFGHALYKQGLPVEWYGLPLGEPISLGIDESQSRLWENLVGRSRGFLSHILPKVKAHFPELNHWSVDEMYRAVNRVESSLIRVEADELTYNLHIMVRFELEKPLIEGELSVGDLPQAWADGYERHLGIRPKNFRDGLLQDIHWAGGAIGYFPTYTLGNIYSAIWFQQAELELGKLEPMFARGEFGPLREWLREKIHRHGKRFDARELVTRITGADRTAEPLLSYLESKFSEL